MVHLPNICEEDINNSKNMSNTQEIIWKPVKGYEEYAEISNMGQIHRFEKVWYCGKDQRIKHIQEETWTYGSDDGRGYLKAGIGNVNKRVHVWVYLTFVGDIPEGYEVNHIDEDKHNNCVWNLNLMTPKDNSNWGTRNERIGDAHRGMKRSEETKAKISDALKGKPRPYVAVSKSKAVQALDPTTMEVVYEFPSTMEAGRQGFCQSSVSACCRGELKTHKGLLWQFKKC